MFLKYKLARSVVFLAYSQQPGTKRGAGPWTHSDPSSSVALPPLDETETHAVLYISAEDQFEDDRRGVFV